MKKTREEFAGFIAQFEEAGALKTFANTILGIVRELNTLLTALAAIGVVVGGRFLGGKLAAAGGVKGAITRPTVTTAALNPFKGTAPTRAEILARRRGGTLGGFGSTRFAGITPRFAEGGVSPGLAGAVAAGGRSADFSTITRRGPSPFMAGLKNQTMAGGGLAGFGLLSVAGHMETIDRSSIAMKAGVEGLGVSFLALAAGVNPVIAAMAGLGTAVLGLDQSFREANAFQVGQAIDRSRGNPVTLLNNLNRELRKANTRESGLLDLMVGGNIEQAAFDVKNPLTAARSLEDLVRGKIPRNIAMLSARKTEDVVAQFPKVQAEINDFIEAFKDSGQDISKLEEFEGGALTFYSQMFDMIDDKTLNNSRSLQEYIEKTVGAEKATRNLIAEREEETKTAKKLADASKQVQTLMQKRASIISGLAGVQERGFSFAQTQAQFAGRSFNPRGFSNRLAIGQARGLAGTANVQALVHKLSMLTATTAGRSEPERAIIDAVKGNVVQALKLLADTAKRTSSDFQALNDVMDKLNAKLGVVEDFYSADAKEREKMREDKKIAQSVIGKGTLKGFEIEEQQASLRFLNRVANIEGAGIGAVGGTGAQIKERILTATAGRFVEPEVKERGRLQSKILKVQRDADNAHMGTVSSEITDMRDFITNRLDPKLSAMLGVISQQTDIPTTAGIAIDSDSLTNALNAFGSQMDDIVSRFPRDITLNADHTINVSFSGTAALGTSVYRAFEDNFKRFAKGEVARAMREFIRREMPAHPG
jgi:hypothetical protein